MVIQDDTREIELIELFQLERPHNAGRSETDAVLRLEDQLIQFELKSTTRGSVTTVRDFGPDHVEKWKDKHWLIGFYSSGILRYCVYGSPSMMAPWISSKEEYVRLDFELAEMLPELVTQPILDQLVGSKSAYSIEEARNIQKRQLSTEQYEELQDLFSGYSPQRMVEILQDRCRYLLRRGSTLNNPHIPSSYFSGWEQITENHSGRLRELVVQALDDMA